MEGVRQGRDQTVNVSGSEARQCRAIKPAAGESQSLVHGATNTKSNKKNHKKKENCMIAATATNYNVNSCSGAAAQREAKRSSPGFQRSRGTHKAQTRRTRQPRSTTVHHVLGHRLARGLATTLNLKPSTLNPNPIKTTQSWELITSSLHRSKTRPGVTHVKKKQTVITARAAADRSNWQ